MSVTEQRRQTPTERLHEVTMAAMQRRPSEAEHGVELSRNARGVVQFTLTVRGPNIEAVIQTATEKFDLLDARYPYPVTNGGGE